MHLIMHLPGCMDINVLNTTMQEMLVVICVVTNEVPQIPKLPYEYELEIQHLF